MMIEILMWILFIVLVLWIIVSTVEVILGHVKQREELKLNKLKALQLLWTIEMALRDFILAYDDQEPERLLGAYQEAEEALGLIEEAKG